MISVEKVGVCQTVRAIESRLERLNLGIYSSALNFKNCHSIRKKTILFLIQAF